MFSLLENINSHIKHFSKKVVFSIAPELDTSLLIRQSVRSIPEMISKKEILSHVTGMTVIRDSSIEKYNYSSELPPWFRTEMHFARRHVYRLKNVYVNVKTGACASNNNYFQESYGSLRRCLLESPFPKNKRKARTYTGAVTCIHTTGYYHFLLEELPRLLWALQNVNDLRVMVHCSAPIFIFDLLEQLKNSGVINKELLVLNEDSVYLEDYVFTQAEAYSGFVHSSDIKVIQNTLVPAPIHNSEALKKIYLSRKNAARSFDNEADLEKIMQKSEFEILQLERISIREQMLIFKKANVIVSPHGAGLSNLIWCKPGIKVVEIFSSKQVNDCYARLCSTIGLSYIPFWATPSNHWGLVEIEKLIAIAK